MLHQPKLHNTYLSLHRHTPKTIHTICIAHKWVLSMHHIRVVVLSFYALDNTNASEIILIIWVPGNKNLLNACTARPVASPWTKTCQVWWQKHICTEANTNICTQRICVCSGPYLSKSVSKNHNNWVVTSMNSQTVDTIRRNIKSQKNDETRIQM